ncbi:MAG: hypothetical protein GPOALKHO_001093 [Sodalis sp.]|nr:MAG: hypothetical protein GPOALKHO_001093 [Sodalis sp.]
MFYVVQLLPVRKTSIRFVILVGHSVLSLKRPLFFTETSDLTRCLTHLVCLRIMRLTYLV